MPKVQGSIIACNFAAQACLVGAISPFNSCVITTISYPGDEELPQGACTYQHDMVFIQNMIIWAVMLYMLLYMKRAGGGRPEDGVKMPLFVYLSD